MRGRLRFSGICSLLLLCFILSPLPSLAAIDGGYSAASELWLKAVLQVPGNPVTLIWKEVGSDLTPSGDQVVSGYFYASPDDFAYGSQYNPEVFVKIYIASNGWANIAFNHVTVDPVSVYSAHDYAGSPAQSGSVTLTNRLVENQYTGVAIDDTDGGTNGTVTGSTRLQPADFSYSGAFRLPTDFNWGARGLCYYADGNGGSGALMVTGFDVNPPEFAQVSIPDPSIETNWQDLPEAVMLTPMTIFDGGLVAQYGAANDNFEPDFSVVSGIVFVPQQGTQVSAKLYGSIDYWYGVVEETHATVWFSEMDGSNARGLYHVGPETLPFHGNKAGDYLFTVPQWYADQYLGGRILITGKTRGAFNGSQGPTLFAFMPWNSENPSGNLDAVAMLWYNIIYPDCAGPDVGDKANCDYPDFTMCDKWEGGGFVESGDKRAIILAGIKGLGDNTYGAPPSPDSCLDSQGYHCDPYERQVIFYDVDELGESAGGSRDPWSVVPYAIWRPESFYLGDASGHTCGEMGGMAVDANGRRVFIIEKGLGGYTNENSAVVHVWSVQ